MLYRFAQGPTAHGQLWDLVRPTFRLYQEGGVSWVEVEDNGRKFLKMRADVGDFTLEALPIQPQEPKT